MLKKLFITSNRNPYQQPNHCNCFSAMVNQNKSNHQLQCYQLQEGQFSKPYLSRMKCSSKTSITGYLKKRSINTTQHIQLNGCDDNQKCIDNKINDQKKYVWINQHNNRMELRVRDLKDEIKQQNSFIKLQPILQPIMYYKPQKQITIEKNEAVKINNQKPEEILEKFLVQLHSSEKTLQSSMLYKMRYDKIQFNNSKLVESKFSQNEDSQSDSYSVVISKFSPNYQKLKKSSPNKSHKTKKSHNN